MKVNIVWSNYSTSVIHGIKRIHVLSDSIILFDSMENKAPIVINKKEMCDYEIEDE
jgi:hypothetical protein